MAYPRCSTSALLYYLTESNHSSVEFLLPGVNQIASDGHPMEDRFFGYDTGRMTFPTKNMVEAFNAENNMFHHRDGTKRKIIMIKNPDYLSAWWSMLRLILIGNVKFLVMTCDIIRWFDYELSRNVAYAASEHHPYSFKTERVQMELHHIKEEFSEIYDNVLQDDTNMVNLISSMHFLMQYVEPTHYLVMHSDMFRENSHYALYVLAMFLDMDGKGLASFPSIDKKSHRSPWKTDICTSSLYIQLKERLTSSYHMIGDLFFAKRGLDVPTRFLSKISKCEEDLLN